MSETSEGYFYVKSDADHYDLADIFGGVYLKNEKVWRFKSEQKDEVTNFLRCSSSESEEGMEDENDEIVEKKQIKRNRLHRSNSFNASDDSNESCDSFDENYRRRRKSKSAITKERNRIEQQKSKD
ncbi:MAG: hypothetical protein ACRDAQ_00820 [Cetobacterium sp.]